MAGLRKGGIGSASIDLGSGLIVAALVAVNAIGSVLMPDGQTYWAWPFELDAEFGGAPPPHRAPGGGIAAPAGAVGAGMTGGSLDASDPAPDDSRLLGLGRLQPGANTTLGVVACSAALTTVECTRVAMMAQDGIARAVRPAHTPYDGDTVFALAGGTVALDEARQRASQVGRIGSAAADCMARAIARAVYHSR